MKTDYRTTEGAVNSLLDELGSVRRLLADLEVAYDRLVAEARPTPAELAEGHLRAVEGRLI